MAKIHKWLTRWVTSFIVIYYLIASEILPDKKHGFGGSGLIRGMALVGVA